MCPDLDREQWSGEGDFTETLVDWFLEQDIITFLKIEDSLSTRSDVDYNFISNEIFLSFLTRERVKCDRRFGFFPRQRTVFDKVMTIEQLETVLAEDAAVGPPDYADKDMIQYLRTERIIPPYQTKGYKLVELVRIYEVGTRPRL